MLFLKNTSPTGKERHYDSFLAGLLGGYTVFGRTIHNSVSQQIVIYVAARVLLALAKLAAQPRNVGGGGSAGGVSGGGGGWELFGNGEMRRAMVRNGWPVFASLSWAMVMYIFRWHPESVQSSLRSSMSYMCVSENILMYEIIANNIAAMYSPMTGIPFGRYFGTTSKPTRVCFYSIALSFSSLNRFYVHAWHSAIVKSNMHYKKSGYQDRQERGRCLELKPIYKELNPSHLLLFIFGSSLIFCSSSSMEWLIALASW